MRPIYDTKRVKFFDLTKQPCQQQIKREQEIRKAMLWAQTQTKH